MAKRNLSRKSGNSKSTKASPPPKTRLQSRLPVPLASLRDVEDAEFSVEDLSPDRTPKPFQKIAAGAITLVPRMILSDPIGSGKTVSSILGIRKLFETGDVRCAIGVTPGSVLHQWKTEFHTWFPNVFAIEVADGDVESREKIYARMTANWGNPLRHVHILLLSYAMSRQDKDKLLKLRYDMIFFDEITHLKDETTEQSKAGQALADKADRTLGITALPVQSKFEEIYPLFNVVDDTLFESRRKFVKNFCHTWSYSFELPNGRTVYKTEIRGYKNLEVFKTMVSSHLLYRTEDDIGLQMPQQIILPRWLTMTGKQAQRYNEVSEGWLHLDGQSAELEPIQQLVRLGQICDGTQLVYPEASSCKIAELRSLLTTELAGDQVVIFSKWTEMLDVVRDEVLVPLGIKHGSIVGGQSPAFREDERLRFQGGEYQVLLLSTAGEEGLNLGAAKCMICCDSLYNEGRMRQVYGRIRRLSTVHPIVRVILLLCKNSIEERIMALREKRAALIDYLDDPAGMDPRDLLEVMRAINKQVSLLN